MKKKILATILATTMTLAIVACGANETISDNQATESKSEIQTEEAEVKEGETVTDQAESLGAEEMEEMTEERVRDLSVYEPDYSSNELSYDEINFYINGIKYTLGETILQDLIDDGIEFTQSYDEISSMKAEYTTCEVTAILPSGAEVKLTTGSEYNITANEMPIVEISCDDFDVLAEGELFFDFQADLNRTEFKEKYGEPTDETEMNVGTYMLEYKEKTVKTSAFGSSNYTAYIISFYAADEENLQSINLYVPF